MESYNNPQFQCYENIEDFPRGNADEKVIAYYFGQTTALKRDIYLPYRNKYVVEVIDTYNRQRHTLDGLYSGICEIETPQKPYIVVFAKR